MRTHTTNPHGRLYYYYSCTKRRKLRKMCDCKQASVQPHKVESVVWEFVSGLLKDPEHIRHGMEKMIALELQGAKLDPEREAALWTERLAEMDRKRSRYQEMAVEGLITFDELRAKLADLEETRATSRRELEGLRHRRERVEELERDREALLTQAAATVPKDLETVSGAQRNKLYRMLRLEVSCLSQGGYRVEGAFCTSESLSWAVVEAYMAAKRNNKRRVF